MKWKRASRDYVEDRRGQTGGGGFGGGGGYSGGGIPIPIPTGRAGGISGIGLVILIAFIALQMCGGGLGGGSGPNSGGDPGGVGGAQAPAASGSLPPEEEQVEFIKAVVEDVQDDLEGGLR